MKVRVEGSIDDLTGDVIVCDGFRYQVPGQSDITQYGIYSNDRIIVEFIYPATYYGWDRKNLPEYEHLAVNSGVGFGERDVQYHCKSWKDAFNLITVITSRARRGGLPITKLTMTQDIVGYVSFQEVNR